MNRSAPRKDPTACGMITVVFLPTTACVMPSTTPAGATPSRSMPFGGGVTSMKFAGFCQPPPPNAAEWICAIGTKMMTHLANQATRASLSQSRRLVAPSTVLPIWTTWRRNIVATPWPPGLNTAFNPRRNGLAVNPITAITLVTATAARLTPIAHKTAIAAIGPGRIYPRRVTCCARIGCVLVTPNLLV